MNDWQQSRVNGCVWKGFYDRDGNQLASTSCDNFDKSYAVMEIKCAAVYMPYIYLYMQYILPIVFL